MCTKYKIFNPAFNSVNTKHRKILLLSNIFLSYLFLSNQKFFFYPIMHVKRGLKENIHFFVLIIFLPTYIKNTPGHSKKRVLIAKTSKFQSLTWVFLTFTFLWLHFFTVENPVRRNPIRSFACVHVPPSPSPSSFSLSLFHWSAFFVLTNSG